MNKKTNQQADEQVKDEQTVQKSLRLDEMLLPACMTGQMS